MANQIVALTSAPNQVLSVSLNVNNTKLSLRLSVSFNAMGGFWVMNIANQQGVPIMNSIPLVTGVWPGANILAPYQYLGIGSAYVINSSGTNEDLPGQTSLGADFVLLWGDNA